MNIDIREAPCSGQKLVVCDDHGVEIGRAYLYIMTNDWHAEPFGLLEDVFIVESMRGQGIGPQLVQQVIDLARAHGCYKLIATSRYSCPKVHALYTELGFQDYGKEFRITF